MHTAAQTDLFEALLASCQKPTATTIAPGFGRELTPYFAPEDFTAPARKAAGTRSAGSSPKRAQRKAAAQAAAAAAAAAATVAAAKKANKKPASVPAKATPKAQVKTVQYALAATPTSWAGPGFCLSPTPDQLPLPTTALLN